MNDDPTEPGNFNFQRPKQKSKFIILARTCPTDLTIIAKNIGRGDTGIGGRTGTMLGKDITAGGRGDFSFMGGRGGVDLNHASSIGSAFDLNVGGSKKNKGGDMSLFGPGPGGPGGKNSMIMDSQNFLGTAISGGPGASNRKRDR